MPPYRRTAQQRTSDLAASKSFEAEVKGYLGEHVVDRTEANDALDFWVPGLFVEVKEKRQPLTTRWTDLAPWIPERDLFILDELSVRRACNHWPEAYFLIRDAVCNRLFVGSVVDLVSIDRVRVNRVGKGKWLIDLKHLDQIEELGHLVSWIRSDLTEMRWKRSECLTRLPVPQV